MIINAFFVVNKVSHITKFVEGRRNVTQENLVTKMLGTTGVHLLPRLFPSPRIL